MPVNVRRHKYIEVMRNRRPHRGENALCLVQGFCYGERTVINMWKSSGCALRGISHAQSGIPCQDKIMTFESQGTQVICLADGAGSARLSHFGADCVVYSCSTYLCSHFDEIYENEDGRGVKIELINHLLDALSRTASAAGCELRDLASTLLVVAVKDDRFIAGHIGDGVIGYLDGDKLKVASVPSNGEHANETCFVTSSMAPADMRMFKGNIKNICGFILMSDGTEQSLYGKRDKTLSGAVLKLMQRNVLISRRLMNEQLENTFEQLIIPKTGDDCSVAILSRIGGAIKPLEGLTVEEKCALFGLKSENRDIELRLGRMVKILECIEQGKSIEQLSKIIHVKPKYVKKYLDILVNAEMAERRMGIYRSRENEE